MRRGVAEAFGTSGVTFGKCAVFPGAVCSLAIKRTMAAAPLRAAGGSGRAGAPDAGPWHTRTPCVGTVAAVAEAERPGAPAAVPRLRFGPQRGVVAEEPRAERHPRFRVWGRKQYEREEAGVSVWDDESGARTVRMRQCRRRAHRDALQVASLALRAFRHRVLERGTAEKATRWL